MAKLSLTWTPTPGMKSQTLQITANGIAQAPVALPPDAASYVDVDVSPKEVDHVELWYSDGFLDSAHAVFDGTCPDFTPPAMPQGLTGVYTPS